jgi:hypothetical protein
MDFVFNAHKIKEENNRVKAKTHHISAIMKLEHVTKLHVLMTQVVSTTPKTATLTPTVPLNMVVLATHLCVEERIPQEFVIQLTTNVAIAQ